MILSCFAHVHSYFTDDSGCSWHKRLRCLFMLASLFFFLVVFHDPASLARFMAKFPLSVSFLLNEMLYSIHFKCVKKIVVSSF